MYFQPIVCFYLNFFKVYKYYDMKCGVESENVKSWLKNKMKRHGKFMLITF